MELNQRFLEAYVGEYASGKSEISVNRSLRLRQMGHKVRLVDLDLIEPFYTLRPLKQRLEREGIDVIAWETVETIGLGEAAIPLKPEMVHSLKYPGDVILDVGHGRRGRDFLKLVHGALEKELKIYLVVNTARPLTSSAPLITNFARNLGRVDGLINNTHLGGETTVAMVQRGAEIVARAARDLNQPVIATTALDDLAARIGPYDSLGHEVWPLNRWMKDAVW